MASKIAFVILPLICVIIQQSDGHKTSIWSIEKIDDKFTFTISDKRTLLEILKILTDKISAPLKEVAQGKNASQSSTLKPYDAGKAVDGDINTFQHTGVVLEQSPFWLVDLGRLYLVKRIEIINRLTLGNRFHDVDILVSSTSSKDGFQLFAHYKGPGLNGERLVFNLERDIYVRYVKLMMKGKEWLHVSEVKVYAYDN